VEVLALFHIPHYVCGGFAVQEHGDPRFTMDVAGWRVRYEEAVDERLRSESRSHNDSHGQRNESEVYLLPGGKKVDPAALTLPVPTHVLDKPQILAFEKLISSKPSTYIGAG